jgi:hypothetical protein
LVLPNTPCSRPRWRGRELGATWGRKLRRSIAFYPLGVSASVYALIPPLDGEHPQFAGAVPCRHSSRSRRLPAVRLTVTLGGQARRNHTPAVRRVMACHCRGCARRATRFARRRANTRFRSAVRMVMACRCGGRARRATRSACRRANSRFRSALRMVVAFRCGGRAGRATRCACRRAHSRWYRAYGHGVSLRRARRVGDPLRASAHPRAAYRAYDS